MITIARCAEPPGLGRARAAHLASDRDTNRILAGASAARAPQAWLLACAAATVVGAIYLLHHGPARWSAMIRAAALQLAARWQQHTSHAACLVPSDIADILVATGSGAVSTTRLVVLVATATPAAAGPGCSHGSSTISAPLAVATRPVPLHPALGHLR
jgi:hypothetical protein